MASLIQPYTVLFLNWHPTHRREWDGIVSIIDISTDVTGAGRGVEVAALGPLAAHESSAKYCTHLVQLGRDITSAARGETCLVEEEAGSQSQNDRRKGLEYWDTFSMNQTHSQALLFLYNLKIIRSLWATHTFSEACSSSTFGGIEMKALGDDTGLATAWCICFCWGCCCWGFSGGAGFEKLIPYSSAQVSLDSTWCVGRVFLATWKTGGQLIHPNYSRKETTSMIERGSVSWNNWEGSVALPVNTDNHNSNF